MFPAKVNLIPDVRQKKRQPYFIFPHYLKLYNYNGTAKKEKKMEYQMIPFHYIRAEKSHLEMSFGSRRSNSASVREKAIAWW